MEDKHQEPLPQTPVAFDWDFMSSLGRAPSGALFTVSDGMHQSREGPIGSVSSQDVAFDMMDGPTGNDSGTNIFQDVHYDNSNYESMGDPRDPRFAFHRTYTVPLSPLDSLPDEAGSPGGNDYDDKSEVHATLPYDHENNVPWPQSAGLNCNMSSLDIFGPGQLSTDRSLHHMDNAARQSADPPDYIEKKELELSRRRTNSGSDSHLSGARVEQIRDGAHTPALVLIDEDWQNEEDEDDQAEILMGEAADAIAPLPSGGMAFEPVTVRETPTLHITDHSEDFPEDEISPLRHRRQTDSAQDFGSFERRKAWARKRTNTAPCLSSKQPSSHMPIEDQKIHLTDLPPEILQLIFIYAVLSPTSGRGGAEEFGQPPRRRTDNPKTTSASQPTDSKSKKEFGKINTVSQLKRPSRQQRSEFARLPARVRYHPARTLLRLALTCRLFNDHLYTEYIDRTLWRAAARWCWPQLPDSLEKVQGYKKSSQTSWRNLFGVFMKCEIGHHKGGKDRSGKAGRGVEGFGGKRACRPAILWDKAQHDDPATSCQNDKRRVALLCTQHGPDTFHASPNRDGNGYFLTLGLNDGVFFVNVDRHGNFGMPQRLGEHLRRSDRGQLATDVYELRDDRLTLVRIKPTYISKDAAHDEDAHAIQNVKEDLRWDLSCVEEIRDDKQAGVARCGSSGNRLAFNLFTMEDSPLQEFLDPAEDNTLYCVEYVPSTERDPSKTNLLWEKRFDHPYSSVYPPARQLHYTVCNIECSDEHAVVLVRWNIRSENAFEELVSREFWVLSLDTGIPAKILKLHPLDWDHRHHDMHEQYNRLRLEKLGRLYNYWGAGNRSTRIHDDEFCIVTSHPHGKKGKDRQNHSHHMKVISGSHDYCNFVWDLSDPGIEMFPQKILDDYYWEEEDGQTGGKNGKWKYTNERAGWWVNTPNQVLDYWHGVATSTHGKYFAACRAGKMFVWDMSDIRRVEGYTCELSDDDHDTPETPLDSDTYRSPVSSGRPSLVNNTPSTSFYGASADLSGTTELSPTISKDSNVPSLPTPREHKEVSRWLGRTSDKSLQPLFRNWFEMKHRLPEQGLWIMYEPTRPPKSPSVTPDPDSQSSSAGGASGNGAFGSDVVYLGRDDILEACGLQDKNWMFDRAEFVESDSSSESSSSSDEDDDEDGSDSSTDEETTDNVRHEDTPMPNAPPTLPSLSRMPSRKRKKAPPPLLCKPLSPGHETSSMDGSEYASDSDDESGREAQTRKMLASATRRWSHRSGRSSTSDRRRFSLGYVDDGEETFRFGVEE